MAALIALSMMAAQVGAAPSAAEISEPWNSRVSASVRASVRILSAAKISLSGEPQPDGYKLTTAQVRLEDGTRRPAKLVEFQ